MNNKKILVILTGGTISMKNIENSKRADINSEAQSIIKELKNGLRAIEIDFNVFSLIPSPSMTPEKMFSLSKLIKTELSRKTYDGIVVTHGTDTMEETAFFIDTMISDDTPVVMTGSMRNLSELGFDGISNLASACLVAASNESMGRGVLVVMNDEINSASEVMKTHTVALDTFKSPEFGPLGIVDQDDVLYYRNNTSSSFHFDVDSIESNVEIVKVSAGSDSRLIKFLVDDGVRGIVLEALGRGNVPPSMVDGIKYARSKNIPVVLTSRCFKGRVLDTYVYEGGGAHLRSLGVLFTSHLTSQKARIKLIIALKSSVGLEECFSSI